MSSLVDGEASVRALLEHLAKELVDAPEQVSVIENPGDGVLTYEIQVAPEDVGKVIGKQGRIANALRLVARGASAKESHRVQVDIRD